jgi:hypothetical protein
MRTFPEQNIPITQKDKNWYAKHLDYAQDVIVTYNGITGKMDTLYNSYNGIKTPTSLAWLEKTYGKQNRAKYVAYRVGRTKLDLLWGEWLKRPLTATVETTNVEARSQKMAQLDFMMGAMIARQELKDLKDKAGVDVMEGMPIPESQDDPIWRRMSPKDKDEDIMQIILDEQVKALDLQRKIGQNFLDLMITSMCYGMVEINEEGDVNYEKIDPRDAIYEHIEGDDYLEKSPIRGCRRILPIHEIKKRYQLSDEQIRLLDTMAKNPNDYRDNRWIQVTNGELLCSVIHIEWESWDPEYYKISPKTNAQMEIDNSTGSYVMEITADKYEPAMQVHAKNVEAGKYGIETKWSEQTYEATRIGGLPELDVNCRRKYFQKRSEDDPSRVLSASYHGFIFNTVNGTRVSLQEKIQNFDTIFDITMYQILKELSRAKGKVITYDRAGLPQKRKLSDVIYQAVNDQFLDYDSSAAGNMSQRQMDPASAFKEIDLGLSQSFEYLLVMKNDILNTLNQITGINENREGQIAASSTASNANSAIAASRTITEPLFFGMQGFVERVMKSIIDSTKVSWAFYKLDKGEHILGADKLRYLQVTKEIGYKDYDAHVDDGGEYLRLRQEMDQLMAFDLQAGGLKSADVLKVKLAKTTAQMKNTLEEAWMQINKVAIEQQQMDMQNQQAMQQQQLQTNLQIAQEDREDRQVSAIDEINAKTQGQVVVENVKAKNKMFENQHKAENDLLNSQNVTDM